MKYKGLSILLVIGFLVAGVYGCSGGGGGSDVTVNPPQPGSVGTLNAASAVCAQCHLAQATQYALALHNTENAATCARCHEPAPGHPNPTVALANPDGAGKCLECHAGQTLPHLNPAIVNVEGSFVGDGVAAQYVDAALTSPVNDTLFPGLPGAQAGCRACHNSHDTSSRMSLFRDYSRNSGHGDVNGAAWVHYRWKGADRASCQRCHTTSAFITATTPGDGRTSLTFNANDNTKQTLYCNACHVDNTYAVRPVGAVVESYTNGGSFNTPDDQNPVIDPVTGLQTPVNTMPNIGKSNLCLNCHAARAIGDSIKRSTGDFSNVGFTNSHYLTGGATVYGVSGYEYAGRNYVNRGSYAHSKIGTSLEPATGDSGPCVGCHMTPARHTFKGWTKDAATDRITSITSLSCGACHGDMTPETMNEQKELFEATLAVLQAQLVAKGVHFAPNNPYFFTAPYVAGGTNTAVRNWLSPGDTDITGNTTGKNNMGAAFNLNLLIHDPGAYTHNRYYVKRLLYDSMDWADNNVLDDSTVAATDALLAAGKITQAQHDLAITYVLRQGARP